MGKEVLTPNAGVGQPVTFQICIYNRSGSPQSISFASDSFPSQWVYASCDSSDQANIQCTSDGQPNGGSVSWGPSSGSQYVLPNNADLLLFVTGSYNAAGTWCNAPGNYSLTLSTGTIGGVDRPCAVVN